MTYERFIVLNERIKYNNTYRKIVIKGFENKDTVSVSLYEKEVTVYSPKKKVWCHKSEHIVSVFDLVNSINEESSIYLSNPSCLKHWTGFDCKDSLVINHELLCDLYYELNDSKNKGLVFKRTLDKELNLLLAKESLKGSIKKYKIKGLTIFETDNIIYVISNKRMCCLDGSYLFSIWSLKFLDISEIDFSECDTFFKAFDSVNIDKLVLDFSLFPNLNTISYMFCFSHIKELILFNLDLLKIKQKEDWCFKATVDTCKLFGCNLIDYNNIIKDFKYLKKVEMDAKTKKYLKKCNFKEV